MKCRTCREVLVYVPFFGSWEHLNPLQALDHDPEPM